MTARAATLLAWCLFASMARADGGAPVATMQSACGRSVLLVQPAQPTVGEVAFIMLGPAACGQAIVLEERQGEAWVPIPMAWNESESAWMGRTHLEGAGAHTMRWGLDGGAPQPLELLVAASAPAWQSNLPWLLWWVPAGLLLVVRARALRARNYTARRAA